MNTKNYNKYLIKVSGTTGFLIAVLAFLILVFPSNISISAGAVIALCLFVSTFLSVFFIIRQSIVKRLKMIDRITYNISKKRFEEYKKIGKTNNNKLNQLVSQTIKASKTTEREINRLKKIENYRKEFIGDISHELKTPIFAIKGFIETLLNGAIDDEKVNREFLEKALNNANRLTFLTKDLMEISKLETGELQLEIETLNLAEIISEAVENLQYKAEEEGVLIQIMQIDQDIKIRANRNQLKQILINIIENGIKYNKIGGLVTVGAKEYSSNGKKILVSIKDTGIGIRQEYIERITERFFRIDKSRSREKGGTGLGLAIVKHILEAHGEELFVESTAGKGSVFSFTLERA